MVTNGKNMLFLKSGIPLFVVLFYFFSACSSNSFIRKNELLVAQGRHQEAIENYRSLIEQEPDNAEYHYRIAKIYFSLQEYQKSIDAVKKAILLVPNQSRFQLLAGKGKKKKKDYFHAIRQLTSAIGLDDESLNTYYYLALSYDQAGNTEEAIKQLNLAIALEPLYFDAHLALVSIRFERSSSGRDYETLIVQLKKALAIHPTSIPGNILLSKMYYAAGKSQKAAIILKKHAEINGDTDDVLSTLAHIEYQSGQYQAAARTLQRLRTKNLASQLLSLRIKYELTPQADLKPAIESLLAEHPHSEALHLFSGVWEYRLGNLDRAERSFQSALKIDPSFGEAYFHLSQIWRDRNDFVGFGNALKKAFELEPNHPEILITYLRLLIERGDWERASDLLDERQQQRQNAQILYIRGLIAKRKGLYYEAENLFRQSQQKRFAAEVETQIADMEILRGRYRAAEKRLRLVLQHKPHDIDAVLVLAKLYFATQRADRIPPLLTPYVSNERGKGQVHRQLAEAWIQLNQIEQAVTVLEDGLENWPRHPELVQMQTLYLGLMGDYEKAIRILEDMQTFNHKYRQLFHYRLSGYYHKTGNREKFKEYLYRYNMNKGLEQYNNYLYRYIIRQNLTCSKTVPSLRDERKPN